MAKCINTYKGSETNGNTMVTIINFFMEKGLTDNQTACVVGSIEKTSNFKADTEVTEDKKTYIGICKWEGDRATKLQEYAKQNNKDWKDLGLQLDYLWSELNGTYKKIILDWFTSNATASIKECVKKWVNDFIDCTTRKCGNDDIIKKAKGVISFYKKYADGECSSVENTNNDNTNNEEKSETASNTEDSTGLQTDESKPSVNCGVNVTGTIVNGSGGDNNGNNENNTPQETENTTDYNGKTLVLRLEREDFTCDRTIGSLYDTTDGKKQFICYVIEDAVRYKGNKCYKSPYTGGGDGVKQKVSIPYGTYSFSMANSGAAKKCSGKINRDCRYFYAADYKKYSEYNGKLALLSGVNKDGCSFTSILIHSSTDNSRADENNSAGCLVVGMNKQSGYLSGTHDAFYKLYESYILPAAKAGSKMKIEIPRLYSDKDTKCCDKC